MTKKERVEEAVLEFDIYGNRLVVGNTKYFYDDNRNCILIIYNSNDTLSAQRKMIYNKNKLIESYYYRTSEFLSKKTNYYYNEKENLTSVIGINTTGDGNNIYRKEINLKYDKDNNVSMVKQVKFKNDSVTKSYKESFKYDSKGNRIEKTIYRPVDQITGRHVWVYDESNNVIEFIKYYSNGKIRQKILYKYDKNNQEKEALIYSGKDLKNPVLRYSHEYLYDNYRNWIKKTLLVQVYDEQYIGEPLIENQLSVNERKIEYH